MSCPKIVLYELTVQFQYYVDLPTKIKGLLVIWNDLDVDILISNPLGSMFTGQRGRVEDYVSQFGRFTRGHERHSPRCVDLGRFARLHVEEFSIKDFITLEPAFEICSVNQSRDIPV